MKAILLAIVIFSFVPAALFMPYVGILGWSWISFMNPHREVYGFGYNMPWNLIIAVATMAALFFSRERKIPPANQTTVLLVVFAAWFTFTTWQAPFPDVSWPLWNRNIKTILLALMVVTIMTRKSRIQALIWIIAISLGYYGAKGAVMLVAGGNPENFVGARQSMIADNNHLAAALVMTLPLLNYLRISSRWPAIRLVLLAVMVLLVMAVIASFSRGGLVGLVAMMTFLWLKSRQRIRIGLLLAMLAIPAFYLVPESWVERMQTIENAEEDKSFQGRLNSWEVAWKVARERIAGVGFDGPQQPPIYYRYVPMAPRTFAAHSIYFQVLGEHGFIGLILFLLVFFTGWRNAADVIRRTRGDPGWLWAHDLARMIQVSLIGYGVAGAALSLAYYDVPYVLVAITAVLREMVQQRNLARAAEALNSPAVTTTPLATSSGGPAASGGGRISA